MTQNTTTNKDQEIGRLQACRDLMAAFAQRGDIGAVLLIAEYASNSEEQLGRDYEEYLDRLESRAS